VSGGYNFQGKSVLPDRTTVHTRIIAMSRGNLVGGKSVH